MTTNDEPVRLEVSPSGDTTLYIGQSQAMQAWERDLMEFSADLLVSFGPSLAEAGLGLGISTLRASSTPGVESHSVIEIHPEVIRLFRAAHPDLPSALHIVNADFFDWIEAVESSTLDGIFFDPALPVRVWKDMSFWDRHMPAIARSLRPGGAFIPFFSTRPVIREQYLPYFAEIRCFPRPFRAYDNTIYTYQRSGLALVQCFIKG